jgi:hypothetical protein
MRTALLLLFLVIACSFCAAKDVIVRSPCTIPSTRTRAELDSAAKSWDNCYYHDSKKGDVKLDRAAIIDYFKLGFDLNGDGKLSMDECETARNCFFTRAELQFGETCKTVFDRCDCNQDGLITRLDFEKSYFTCLRDCTAGQRIYQYVGQYLGNGTALSRCRNGNDEFV